MRHLLTLLSALLLLGSCAKTEVADPPSVVFNEDGTITFNYRNDSAQSVQLLAQFAAKRQGMVKDSITGLWSLTLDGAAPDIYPYNYIVDGLPVMDDQCDEWFPNEGFKSSLLTVPDPKGAIHNYDLNDVPHGSVDYITYYSKTVGGYNRALVYMPASYDGEKKFPVLYLISGTTDTEETFFKVGRINRIMDNLIARGVAQEMMIVLPYRNPLRNDDAPRDINIDNDPCGKDLEQDLIPYIEANYCTINDADHRAIGGFSRGGNQALDYGLSHLDQISYILSYSGYTSYNLEAYKNVKAINEKLNLLWLGIGKDDYLFKTVHEYLEFLTTKDICYVMMFSEGKKGHTWMNVRHFLTYSLPLVFNKENSKELMAGGMMVMPELKGNERKFNDRVLRTMFPDKVVSPDYSEPGTVTLRFKADNAKRVLLEGEMLAAPAEMQKGDKGIWSITLTGIKPDVYAYNFVVDGTRVIDMSNTVLVPEHGFKHSVMELPGSAYSVENGIRTENPEASLQYSPVRYFRADSLDTDDSEYFVFSPARDYRNLPIVNLYSGKKFLRQSWQQVAHANQILDQMVADIECKPCVIYLRDGVAPKEETNPMVKANLNADDYQTWAERRQALIDVLKSIQ